MPSKDNPSFAMQELHGHRDGMNTSNEHPTLTHQLWKLLLGELFDLDASIAVAKALSMQDGVPRSILDIGAGSGTWALDVSRRYPYAKITGIDLAPEKRKYTPSSCKFEVGDVTDDSTLSSLEGKKFDLIHTRSLLGYIGDPVNVIHKIANWLRPGGVYVFADGDFTLLDENEHRVKEVNPVTKEMNAGCSWFACLLSEVSRITHSKLFSTGTEIESWLKQSGLFENIQVRSYLLPVGWAGRAEDDVVDGAQLGRLAHKNFVEYIASAERLLSAHLEADHVEELIKRSKEEVSDPSTHLYLRFHTAWASRK